MHYMQYGDQNALYNLASWILSVVYFYFSTFARSFSLLATRPHFA